jgi:hypothetical protein
MKLSIPPAGTYQELDRLRGCFLTGAKGGGKRLETVGQPGPGIEDAKHVGLHNDVPVGSDQGGEADGKDKSDGARVSHAIILIGKWTSVEGLHPLKYDFRLMIGPDDPS